MCCRRGSRGGLVAGNIPISIFHHRGEEVKRKMDSRLRGRKRKSERGEGDHKGRPYEG